MKSRRALRGAGWRFWHRSRPSAALRQRSEGAHFGFRSPQSPPLGGVHIRAATSDARNASPRHFVPALMRSVFFYTFPCRSFFLSSLVAESIARTTFLLPERGVAAEAGCRRRHLMKRPGSAACQAVDIVGRGIRSERLCMTPAIRPVGANGACSGHPDEAALPQGGETANAAEPLEICVAADIRRPHQLRCLG